MDEAVTELLRSRHEVITRIVDIDERGKFERLRAELDALAEDVALADWLLIVDDDVELPHGFLDRFVCIAERAGLRLAQPAHRRRSHAAWPVTRRHPGQDVRRTRFVEIGPVTALHRDTFAALLPFPPLSMGWGLDVHWGAVAAEHGWPVGVVDATPGPPHRARRRRLRAGGAGRGGAGVPRRPPVRDARRGRWSEPVR